MNNPEENPIIQAIQKWFGDTSRSRSETRAGIEEAIDCAQMMLDTLLDDDGDES